jgi:hypothetical protein
MSKTRWRRRTRAWIEQFIFWDYLKDWKKEEKWRN